MRPQCPLLLPETALGFSNLNWWTKPGLTSVPGLGAGKFKLPSVSSIDEINVVTVQSFRA